MSMLKKYPKIFSLLIGVCLSIFLVGSLELILQLNKSYHWFFYYPRTLDVEKSNYNYDQKLLEKFKAAMQPSIDKFIDYPTRSQTDALYKEGKINLQQNPPGFDPADFFKNRNLKYISTIRSAVNKTTIYEVPISLDEFGTRTVSNRPKTGETQYFFLGCSFTFGEGVKDDETMPFYFQSLNPQSQVYNMGMGGSSIADHLYEMQFLFKGRYGHLGQPKNGIMFYSFFNDHMRRSACPLSCFGPDRVGWQPYKPRYEWNSETNQIEYKGLFATRESINNLYIQLNKIELLNFLGIDWPLSKSVSSVKRFVETVKETKRIAETQFNIKKFYFIFYPTDSSIASPVLENALREAGIAILDLRFLNPSKVLPIFINIPGDGHPTSVANELYARMIDYKLKESEERINKLNSDGL